MISDLFEIEDATTVNHRYIEKKPLCLVCNAPMEKGKNLTMNGRYGVLEVCFECYENRKHSCQELIDAHVKKLEEDVERYLDAFVDNVIFAKTVDCDGEGYWVHKKKIEKVVKRNGNKFRVSFTNTGGEGAKISLHTRDYEDFKEQWDVINEARTACGCSIMYGDYCSPDVWAYKGDVFHQIDVNLIGIHFEGG